VSFPAALDLGFAKVQTDKSGEVVFTNTGRQPGKVTLKSDVKALRIEPASVTLAPGASSSVRISYACNQP
jgi:hypothetical protein